MKFNFKWLAFIIVSSVTYFSCKFLIDNESTKLIIMGLILYTFGYFEGRFEGLL